MALPPPSHDPEEVRQLADEILAQARYRQPARSPFDRASEWLFERFSELVGRLAGGGGGAVVAWIILLAAVAGVVLLLVRYGRVSLPVFAGGEERGVMVELTRTPAEWRSDAERLEAEGRWREGLLCRYRALVAELVRRDAIRDQAGRTAGEYVRDVAEALPDASAPFAAATELFEAAWYGGADTAAPEAARFADLEAGVLSVRVR